MWCEKGIEDGEKPSPFVIQCKCGGFASDISGLHRINKPRPNPLLNYDTGYMILLKENRISVTKVETVEYHI